MTDPPADTKLAEAFSRVLQAVAEWRRRALDNAAEYERRENLLLVLEGVADEVLTTAPAAACRPDQPA